MELQQPPTWVSGPLRAGKSSLVLSGWTGLAARMLLGQGLLRHSWAWSQGAGWLGHPGQCPPAPKKAGENEALAFMLWAGWSARMGLCPY